MRNAGVLEAITKEKISVSLPSLDVFRGTETDSRGDETVPIKIDSFLPRRVNPHLAACVFYQLLCCKE